jgi:hypothetical protein
VSVEALLTIVCNVFGGSGSAQAESWPTGMEKWLESPRDPFKLPARTRTSQARFPPRRTQTNAEGVAVVGRAGRGPADFSCREVYSGNTPNEVVPVLALGGSRTICICSGTSQCVFTLHSKDCSNGSGCPEPSEMRAMRDAAELSAETHGGLGSETRGRRPHHHRALRINSRA